MRAHTNGYPLPLHPSAAEQGAFAGFGMTYREVLTDIERDRYEARRRKRRLDARAVPSAKEKA